MNTVNTAFLRRQNAPFRALITVFVVAILAFILVALTGCAHERVVLKPAQTNEVQVLVTNTVPRVVGKEIVSTRLNPVPGGPDIVTTNYVQETNFVERVETRTQLVVTPEVAYTNVSLSPGVSTAVQVGGAVAPVPWASAATGIFGTVTAGIFAWVNNRRRQKALGEAHDWANTAKVLVENVEAVRQQAMRLPGYTPEIDKRVVRVLEETQRAAGVKARVEGLVEAHTDYTTDTVPLAAAPAAPDLMGTTAAAPSLKGVPPPVERPAPGDRPNRPVSELIAFAKSGAAIKQEEWSAADVVSILQIRGQV